MSFVVLLLAIVSEKFSSLRQRFQRDGGWLRELHALEASPKFATRPWLVLAILILCPVALLALLLWVLDPVAYGLLALPVHVLVVIYSLGRGDIQAGLGPFRDAWRRGDLQAGAHVAERDIGITAENGEQLLEKVQSHLLWQSYQGFFAVIFWYFLLGPVAALSYRLLALAAEHGKNPELVERAQQLRHAFDWVPVGFAASSAGEYTFTLFAVVSIALLVSWLVAVIFAPLIGIYVLKAPKNTDRGPGRIMRIYRSFLSVALAGRWITIAVTLVLFVVSVMLMPLIPRQFFPASDRSELLIDLELPQNSSIYATERAMERLDVALKDDPDVARWSGYVGRGAIRFYLPLDAKLPNDFFGQAVVVAQNVDARLRLQEKLTKDRKSTRLNSSHNSPSRMPSSA